MAIVLRYMDGLPEYWPAAVLVALVVATAAAAVGRVLGGPAGTVFLLVGSVGLIVATTLTPATVSYFVPGHPATCLVRPLQLPPLYQLTSLNETSLNVALFVPLGLGCALLRRFGQVLLALPIAIAVPIGVEAVQYAVPRLDRVCSTADITANLTGLALGFLIGLVVLRPLAVLLRSALSQPPQPFHGGTQWTIDDLIDDRTPAGDRRG
jgi:VanZ like family